MAISQLEPLQERPVMIRQLASSLLDGPRHFRVEEMARRGWVVVPVEDSISDEEAERLAIAASARGVAEAVAMTTEPGMRPEQFRVRMTLHDLVAFDAGCHLRYFLLVPEDAAFAVLHEANYYWLLAGPADFVAEVLGRSAAEALTAFESEYAGSADWPRNTRAMLQELGRYRVLLE